MKKKSEKVASYTVTRMCLKCGHKTVHSLLNRSTLTYRCNICGQIIKPFGERKVKAKVVDK